MDVASKSEYNRIFVTGLTLMHNIGPQLFVCIVTFYARRNVSQSVTIRAKTVTLPNSFHYVIVRRKLLSIGYLHTVQH